MRRLYNLFNTIFIKFVSIVVDSLLQPGECRLKGNKRFCDVWAGGFATIARDLCTGVIYACGLNNYGQLALVSHADGDNSVPRTLQTSANSVETVTAKVGEHQKMSESMLLKKQGPLVQFMLTPALGFGPDKDWRQFAIGMHHILALTESGEVFSVGRSDYGRLGCPFSADIDNSAVVQPQLVQGSLIGHKCCWVGCGEACSFAIDEKG